MTSLLISTPVSYTPSVFLNADELFTSLWNDLNWVKLEGSPRKEYYCNEIEVPYSYGNPLFAKTFTPQPWHPAILEIKSVVESLLETKFEVCFLNGYANSKDHIGWHSDNSPEMDDKRPIAIVSLGAEREIMFREIDPFNGKCIACNGSGKYDTSVAGKIPACSSCLGTGKSSPKEVEKLILGNGSVCEMKAGMQDTHQHRIPKAGFDCGPRVSLTFRGYSNP